MDKICFIDFEASSLDPDLSYPTEIGWAYAEGGGGSLLIRPSAAWTGGTPEDLYAPWRGWNENGEAFTGISRGLLLEEGRTVDEVAAAVAAAFEGRMLYADNQDWDAMWMWRLFKAAKRAPIPEVGDFYRLIGRQTAGAAGQAILMLAQARAQEEAPRTHRAGDDARHLAAVYRHVMAG